MTVEGRDQDAAPLELPELDAADDFPGRAVVVPSLPRPQVVPWAGALGLAGWVVTDSGDSGRAFYVGAPDDALAVAIACSGGRSDPPALVLWLDAPVAPGDDESAGVMVAHRRAVRMWHQWPAEDARLFGDAADLADAVGRRDEQVGLRALLRRSDLSPGELLGELVTLTGLPREALGLLTAAAPPPDTEVLVVQPRRGNLATALAVSRTVPPPRWVAIERRWRWLFPAALWLYFTVRAVLAAAAGIGEPGDDVGYAVLAVITGSCALFWRWRRRRSRGRREGRSGGGADEDR